MKKSKSIILSTAAMAALLLTACSDELEPGRSAAVERAFTFDVSTASWQAPQMTAAVNGDDAALPVAAIIGDGIAPVRSLFSAVPDGDASGATRAVAKSDFNTDGSDKFQVACYVSDTEDNFSAGSSLYFNDEVTYADSKWKTATQRVWQKKATDGNMQFYAWWPVDADHVSFDTAAKTISYSLDDPSADDIANNVLAAMTQRDLLYARSAVTGSSATAQVGGETGGAPLQFQHALTAVQFLTSPKIALEGAVIKSITIANVAWQGTLNMTTGLWTADETSTNLRDFTVKPSTGSSAVAEGTQEITTGTSTFFMLPQSLDNEGDNPEKMVFITYEKGGETHTFTASLKGLPAWEPGQTVKYVLGTKSGDAYILYAEQTKTPTHTGGANTAELTVNSYQLVMDGGTATRTKVNWKVTGVSIDGGKTFNAIDAASWTGTGVPAMTPWLTGMADCKDLTPNTTGEHPSTKGNLSATRADLSLEDSRAHEIDLELQGAAEQGTSAAPVDLSMRDARGQTLASRNTANCYVVTAAGHYAFPAVYGNAIKDGADNLANCVHTTYFRNSVTEGDGVAPQSPNIWEDSDGNGGTLTPATAELLWQQTRYHNYATGSKVNNQAVIDASSVSYDASTHMVKFSTCDAADMHQCNAVIALKDAGGHILWSWHIWVTTEMKLDDITVTSRYATDADGNNNAGGTYKSYDFAPVALGTIYSGGKRTYAARSVILQLTQVDSEGTPIAGANKAKIMVKQLGGSDADDRDMYHVFYQWGRKDPFPSGCNEVAGWSVSATKSQQTPQICISQPNIFQLNDDNLFTSNRYNFWNLNLATGSAGTKVFAAPVKKTIYDPCPYGYCVPSVDAFRVNKFKISSAEATAQWSPNHYQGYQWEADGGKTIFFPAMGWRRNANGNIINVGSSYYWSSTPYDQQTAYALMVGRDQVYSVSPSRDYRGGGQPVRPVREN